MKRGRPAISIGIVSLITVFTILLLAVFSVLSLSGSRSDSVLSDRAARAVSDYYLAEAQAEQKLLELSSIVSNDTGTPLRERLEAAGFEISVDTPYPGTVVVYDTPIDDRRVLRIEVGIGEQGKVERLYRQTISTGE
ncbi:MAG TPA: hypothetical protein PL100_03945 [Bacillota bacterium]|jgi:hypothetical protein|nr:hypothetical protein [Bacillota bacterium]HQC48662.1 hypothetical protein [Bacillota bacterium]